MTNQAQQLVWRLENQEPFGNSPPEENPGGLGSFEFNLRFPGQYADKETGLSYNMARDYDASTGRYVQSDPIGLRGGINPYLYVNAIPISAADPSGLLSPYHHGKISFESFEGTGFSEGFAWQVSREVMMFDFRDTQGIEQAHTHAMSRPKQDPWIAQEWTESFINYQLRLCTPQGLGAALHAAQDISAGGHAGYREYGGLLRFEMIFHTIDDWLPSSSQRAAAVERSRGLIEKYLQLCTVACR